LWCNPFAIVGENATVVKRATAVFTTNPLQNGPFHRRGRRRKNTTGSVTRAAIPIALSIAGSDSGGGAGVQADLRTFAAFGVHGTCAITALTAQNTRGVDAVQTATRAVLRAQIEAVLADFRVGAIQFGMVATPALAREVVAVLATHRAIPLILDPVLIATTGARLGTQALEATLRRDLLPRADLVTPNVPEAEALLGRRIHRRDMRAAAAGLLALGARAVLLKGGHLPGPDVSDVLLSRDAELWFHQRRVRGEYHGTGCSLSAAIAASMALGHSMQDAVRHAVDFVQRALATAYAPGKSRLRVLDHLHAGGPPNGIGGADV
jgi:hydroxymethylpyrimidine/phosphomethylpyrimidine kinase